MSESTSGVWTTLAEFVPRLFGAVVVLLLALVVALFLQRLMAYPTTTSGASTSSLPRVESMTSILA